MSQCNDKGFLQYKCFEESSAYRREMVKTEDGNERRQDVETTLLYNCCLLQMNVFLDEGVDLVSLKKLIEGWKSDLQQHF